MHHYHRHAGTKPGHPCCLLSNFRDSVPRTRYYSRRQRSFSFAATMFMLNIQGIRYSLVEQTLSHDSGIGGFLTSCLSPFASSDGIEQCTLKGVRTPCSAAMVQIDHYLHTALQPYGAIQGPRRLQLELNLDSCACVCIRYQSRSVR